VSDGHGGVEMEGHRLELTGAIDEEFQRIRRGVYEFEELVFILEVAAGDLVDAAAGDAGGKRLEGCFHQDFGFSMT
jgi:hypothetical protein